MLISNHSHGRTLYITGEGKSGIVGKRLASSLTSIGISAQFIAPMDWVHGELGHLKEGDTVMMISHSGKNQTLERLIRLFKERKLVTIGMCGNKKVKVLKEMDAVRYRKRSLYI